MQNLLQLVLTALQIGAVYILFALGLTLIFGVLRIVNFAHGQFFTLSALIVAVGVPWLAARGWPVSGAYAAGCVAGVAIASLAGVLAYQAGFRRVQRDMSGSFILSAGLVLLFEGIFLHVFGGAVRPVPPLVEGNVALLGASVSVQRLILCAVAVGLTAALAWALAGTRFGKAMRAMAIDHEAAMLQGIPYLYFDPSFASLAIFVLVMVVLLVRPQGLLGRA